jgi:hypothetical protein
MIVIGIDPDSKAHGVATYEAGRLTKLECLSLPSLMNYFEALSFCMIHVSIHIEDVCGMSAVFRQRQSNNAAVSMKMANSVGRCQQSQVEVERMAEHFGFEVVKHKISKCWKKDDKNQFKLVTGWKGRTNEDTRSAAYFGFLGLSKIKPIKA